MRIRVLEDAIFNVVGHFSLSSGAVRTVGIGEMEAVRGKEAMDCDIIIIRMNSPVRHRYYYRNEKNGPPQGVSGRLLQRSLVQSSRRYANHASSILNSRPEQNFGPNRRVNP